jgi:CRP-like cAMP-binding protein
LSATLFIIETGDVSLIDETKSARRIAQIARTGAILGESAVLHESPYANTAVARTETTTLGFTLQTIRTLLEIDSQICFRWLRLLSDRRDASQRGGRGQVRILDADKLRALLPR